MKFKLNNNDIYLFLIFILISFSLFFKIYFNSHGYLSNDSTNYLAAASSFLNGNFFYSFYEFGNNLEKKYFSNWPVGYPLLISLISLIFNCNVFIASKILNIFFILCIILTFRYYFPKNSVLLSSVFFFSSYIEIFSFSWSEVPFTFFLLVFAINIHYLLIKNNINFFFIVLFLSICLFTTRYIGLFTVAIFFYFLIYFILFKIKKNILTFFFLILFNSIFILLYFYNNYLLTGLIAGIPRGFAPEGNLELLSKLILTLLSELTIPIYHDRLNFLLPILIFQILIILFFYKLNIFKIFSFINSKYKYLFKLFLVKDIYSKQYNVIGFVGLSYLVSIIFVRWIFYFNEYSFRLFGPGTFLIFVWLVLYIDKNLDELSYEKFKKIILILSFTSFILYVPIKTYSRFENSYLLTVSDTIDYYNQIPDFSILIYEKNKHLKYLRPKIQPKKPFKNEDFDSFLKRLVNNNPKIYIDISKEDMTSGFYEKYLQLEPVTDNIFYVTKIK